MAGFVKGDVVVVPFPFLDLPASKRRPALVLASLPGDDILMCQITSQQSMYADAIIIALIDFALGGFPLVSYIRPYRIFTTDKSIIIRRAGTLHIGVINRALQKNN